MRKSRKQKNLVIVALLTAVALLGGCGSGISQEEYDKVFTENEELKSEIESLEKVMEIKEKVADYTARVEEQYKHAKFILYICGKVSNTEIEDYENQIEELYNKVVDSINAVDSINGTINSLDANIDFGMEDETLKAVDGIYESWQEFYKSILGLEKYITGE